ncbi:MAG TPA: DUF2059 domain-containing protein [Gallionella sp.]|nr:DUF2059 domain-containing protein [Gallionella sp.]
MKLAVSFILFALISGTALADDTARNQKIAEIIKAQGVYQQFDDLIQQSKVSTNKFLDESYRKILNDLNAANARSNPKFEAAFRRFSDKAANLWTADDLLAVWTKNYGRNLSDSELDQILAYYQSPVGRKDVAAQQSALAGLSRALTSESQARLAPHVRALTDELKSIIAQEQAAVKSR